MMDNYEHKAYKYLIDEMKKGDRAFCFKDGDKTYYACKRFFFYAKEPILILPEENNNLAALCESISDEHRVCKGKLDTNWDEDLYEFTAEDGESVFVSCDLKKIFGDPLKGKMSFKICGKILAITMGNALIGGYVIMNLKHQEVM